MLMNVDGVGGVDDTTVAFTNVLISEKADDCGTRTRINYLVANTWAYNVDPANPDAVQQQAPQIASEFQGAVPAALEIAFRIRNL